MLKEQKFGIEMEMTGITRKNAAQVIADYFGTSVKRDGTYYDKYTAKDSKGRKWSVMSDGSIREQVRGADGNILNATSEYSSEVVSPILKYEDIEDLQNIVRKLKSAGALVNKSCGIHIHIDGKKHTPQSLRRLVNFMTSRQDLIYEALEIGARGDRWCKKLNAKLLETMKSKKDLSKRMVEEIWYSPSNDGYYGGINHDHYNQTRYHGVNLHSYFSKGTVEFRLFNATLHAGKIKTYVQFCLAVSAWAIESQEKIAFRSMNGYTPQQKVTLMRNVLINRLGLCGDEFKTCRLHLMKPLKKNAERISAA